MAFHINLEDARDFVATLDLTLLLLRHLVNWSLFLLGAKKTLQRPFRGVLRNNALHDIENAIPQCQNTLLFWV